MYFKTADVAGLRIFYREAGDPSKPTIVTDEISEAIIETFGQ
jgi:hypothetical protein